MLEFAVTHAMFGIVVIGVAAISIVVGIVLVARSHDAFAGERSGLWVFHGDADTSPEQIPGERFEERHVLDPDDHADDKQWSGPSSALED